MAREAGARTPGASQAPFREDPVTGPRVQQGGQGVQIVLAQLLRLPAAEMVPEGQRVETLQAIAEDIAGLADDGHYPVIQGEVGDGHCAFRGFARQHLGSAERYLEARTRAFEHLENNRAIYEPLLPGDTPWADYLETQRRGLVRGETVVVADEVILTALSDVYQRRIVLCHHQLGGFVFEFGAHQAGRPVRMVYWDQLHFDSILDAELGALEAAARRREGVFAGHLILSSDVVIFEPSGLFAWTVSESVAVNPHMYMIVEGYWFIQSPQEVDALMEHFCGPHGMWQLKKRDDDLTAPAKVIPNLKADVKKAATELRRAFQRENTDFNAGGLVCTTRKIRTMRTHYLYWNGPPSLSNFRDVTRQIPNVKISDRLLLLMRLEFMASMGSGRREFTFYHFEGAELVKTVVRRASFGATDGVSVFEELCVEFGSQEAHWLVEVARTEEFSLLEFLYLRDRDISLVDAVRILFLRVKEEEQVKEEERSKIKKEER